MSFLAKLYINDRVINVLDCRIAFRQDKDITHKPVGPIHGGQFTLTMPMDRHTDILHQMVSHNQMIDGYIRFFKRDGMSKLIDYEFWDCHVAAFRADFSSQTSQPMTAKLLFSPGVLRIGDVVHKKPWHITDIGLLEAEPTPALLNSGNPQLLSAHYTDPEGHPLEQLYEGMVILVLETRDCIGNYVDVDLSDHQYNFKYKGQLVKDDILRNIKIIAAQQQIELEVIL